MELPKSGTIEISPSILSADFARLADELAVVAEAGLKMVHLDVMDAHFVPNLTFGPPVIAKLRQHSSLFFDAHLMITDAEGYAQRFIDAGVDHITFHVEAVKEPEKLIETIHQQGITAGVTLNPATPVKAIENLIPLCDMVLVMTVVPGFGGQKFMADAAKKIIRIKEITDTCEKDIRIEVDGGISPQTAPVVVKYGADTLVAGNAVFGSSDRIAAVRAIQDACK